MVNCVKTFLPYSLITMQNLVVVSHTVCTHMRGPKNFGDVGALLLGIRDAADPLDHTTLPGVTISNFVALG